MPEFNPTVLRVDSTRERWERADGVISFTDLILRWPYHAIINIAHELHANIYDGRIDEDNPPLALYLCDDVVIGPDRQKILRLRPIHINTPFNPFLSNIHNLIVLRRVVERLEAQNPNYTGKRPLKNEEPSLFLATQDNLKETCIYILKAWHQASLHKKKIKADGDSLTSDFWAEVRKSVERVLPLVSNILSPSFGSAEDIPLLSRSSGMPELNIDKKAEYEESKEHARKFLRQFSLTTDAERLIALEALHDASFPSFKNKEIGELLWPDRQHIEDESRESYGSRLCSKLLKRTGKKWR